MPLDKLSSSRATKNSIKEREIFLFLRMCTPSHGLSILTISGCNSRFQLFIGMFSFLPWLWCVLCLQSYFFYLYFLWLCPSSHFSGRTSCFMRHGKPQITKQMVSKMLNWRFTHKLCQHYTSLEFVLCINELSNIQRHTWTPLLFSSVISLCTI